MKRKIAAVILSTIALAILVPYIFAAPDYIEGTVRSIETNNPIEGLTIDIVNCTNNSQVFNTTTTYANGTFWLDYNNTWGNYSINVSGNPSYIDKQFNNVSQCFGNGTNVTLQLYPVATSSLNVTLKDIANSRPIPDTIVTLYRSNL
ncbi:MAG: carboxypeptidase regulatory-like domain-containing protein, partial [Candidatus Aenigmarchaeota archaeon]|nr:carboxypeptidase regulatory-like domain-containing protein [Candidatus Aenigmarchaeota archaeon]